MELAPCRLHRLNTKRKLWSNPLFPFPARMRNLQNAVTDTLEELEMEDHVDYSIREVSQDRLYHVTFQERRNGNNHCVIAVDYSTQVGDLLDDESWEGDIRLTVFRREGVSELTADFIMELLAITLDPDYFDSDDETVSTISSQPLTPPPSRAQ